MGHVGKIWILKVMTWSHVTVAVVSDQCKLCVVLRIEVCNSVHMTGKICCIRVDP